MKLSVVIPVLNEEENIPLIADSVIRQLETTQADYELLFVDDGSTDRSYEKMELLHRGNPKIKALSFSRNFGHQFALTAGLDYASGDAVVVMDADLQHPPELLHEMIEKWREGYEIVYTLREASEDAGLFKRLTSQSFYHWFVRLTHMDLPANTADFRLIDRKVVDTFKDIRERTRFLRGLTAWVGFRSIGIPYQARDRIHGVTKYHFRRMLRLAVDGIVSFSTAPLYSAIYVGFALAALGSLYGVYIVYSYLSGSVVQGWTSLILLLLVIGGFQLVVMGMIGIYLGKIYDEVKQRPLYILRRSLGVTPQ